MTLERGPLLNLVAVLPSKSSVASRRIIAELEPQVQLANCVYREEFEEPASSFIIKSQSTGSRTIVNYNELPEMTLEEFSSIADELGPRAQWFHFEVRSSQILITWYIVLMISQGRAPAVTLDCLRYIRDKFPSARISVEVEKPGRPGLRELAASADVVFYSKTWALVIHHLERTRATWLISTGLWIQLSRTMSTGTGRSHTRVSLLLSYNRSILSWPARTLLCCTWGQEGAGGFEPNTGKFVHVAPETAEDFQVVEYEISRYLLESAC